MSKDMMSGMIYGDGAVGFILGMGFGYCGQFSSIFGTGARVCFVFGPRPISFHFPPTLLYFHGPVDGDVVVY
jgi:hypothetical protein